METIRTAKSSAQSQICCVCCVRNLDCARGQNKRKWVREKKKEMKCQFGFFVYLVTHFKSTG